MYTTTHTQIVKLLKLKIFINKFISDRKIKLLASFRMNFTFSITLFAQFFVEFEDLMLQTQTHNLLSTLERDRVRSWRVNKFNELSSVLNAKVVHIYYVFMYGVCICVPSKLIVIS